MKSDRAITPLTLVRRPRRPFVGPGATIVEAMDLRFAAVITREPPLLPTSTLVADALTNRTVDV